jgi:hypothetical protein
MLNEFDQYLEERYLSKKAQKGRWYWNHSIKIGRPVAIAENRKWKPGISYCRYADDFVVIVKGNKADAQAIKNECQEFLEDRLKLTLNMEKTHVTHINDGFTFLGHRLIRKRGPKGNRRVVSTIPREKAKNFAAGISKKLSGNYSISKIDMVEALNRKISGWANFYQFTDYTAKTYNHIDRVVFWKLAHWLGRKYRSRIKTLMRKWCKRPKPNKAKTWVLFGRTDKGHLKGVCLSRFVGSPKRPFRWRGPEMNPYLRVEERKAVTSRYAEVAMALSHC